jgi:colicin import membrane protein
MIKILLGFIFVFSNALFAQETETQSKQKSKSEQVSNESEKMVNAKQTADDSKELKRIEKAERKIAKKEEKKIKSEAKAEEKRVKKVNKTKSENEAKLEKEVGRIEDKTNKNTELTLSKIEITQTQEIFSKEKKEVAPKILKSLKTIPIKKSLTSNKISDKGNKPTKLVNPLVSQKKITEVKSIKTNVKKHDLEKQKVFNSKATKIVDKVTGQYKGKKVYTGPHGGRYYLNPKGIKIYIQK